ncbi:MAG: NTP transferase domain-containing protein [Candidatus Doudnabacteria bacterium]|nr:NTP transferase domain-containing protein [Candidatus Doudnabacteria bacterium]
MDFQPVILAAGKGTRMGDHNVPKVLIPAHDKPIISYLLDELKTVPGLSKPVIVVGYKHADVVKALGNDYAYAFQRQQLGTGHAVMAAEKQVTAEHIIVLYGDVPFVKGASIKKLMRLHNEQSDSISMFTTHVPNYEGVYANFSHFGRIVRDKYENVKAIVEYKDATEEQRLITEINPGIYAFNTQWLWDNIHHIQKNNVQGEYYLTDMVALAIEQEKVVKTLPINYKEIIGINTPEQLKIAERIIAKKNQSI